MAGSNNGASDTADRIAVAAVQLAATRGWRTLGLTEIATEAGVKLSELARCYASRPQILEGFERMIDSRMLAGASTPDASEAARDRLFEITMARLDALAPYRDGIRRIARELPLDPASSLTLACALPRSIAWMYAGVGIAIEGPLMPLKLAALGGAYLATLRVWLNDDGADLAKTMAALDRQLDRAQRIAGGSFGRARPAEPAPEPEPATPEPPPARPRARPRSGTRAPRRGTKS